MYDPSGQMQGNILFSLLVCTEIKYILLLFSLKKRKKTKEKRLKWEKTCTYFRKNIEYLSFIYYNAVNSKHEKVRPTWEWGDFNVPGLSKGSTENVWEPLS